LFLGVLVVLGGHDVVMATNVLERPAPAVNVETISRRELLNFVLAYSAPPGIGGLGHHAADVLAALGEQFPYVQVFGPPPADRGQISYGKQFTAPPLFVRNWRRQRTWLRYMHGRYQYQLDARFGRWLASELRAVPFDAGYFFTQIARESLIDAREKGARTILDNPNGHIRDFREKLCHEFERWIGWPYWGHPTDAMVRRVEEEYRLADVVRVSSTWARSSLVAGGVDESKIVVVPQTIDTNRFRPAAERRTATGPLRIAFAGSFTVGKGFQYLLRAIARIGAKHFSVSMVGATGDPWCRRLLADLGRGLDIMHAPGDPVAAYQSAELFVLPTVHDGFGLVVAEAMACGLPVVTTDCCGASETIEPDRTGWIVAAGDEDALAAALDRALSRRAILAQMGACARQTAVRLNDESHRRRLATWVSDVVLA
jgi:glycosyltransferase involved in cell wall biosynthesis